MINRFWSVTSYFNPAGFQSRVENYRVFHKRLGTPLLTVELSHTGQFELGPGDADILIQVRDGDVMWQKERLLNLGIALLPDDCDFVAWLDCDIVFERRDWADAAVTGMRRDTICHLFRTVYHLRPDVAEEAIGAEGAFLSHESMGYAYATGKPISPVNALDGVPNSYRRGHAWGARRDVIAEIQLYDANLIGGGDRMMAYAIASQADGMINRYPFSTRHIEHYREWAGRATRRVRHLAASEGDLFHLWHGAFKNRRYGVRHEILRDAGYDPTTDIAVTVEGCWRWNSPKPNMHRQVREYFSGREEDGVAIVNGA